MNKEYIKLNDDTVIVSDEYGHIITKRNSNDKVLAIENKIEKTLDEIDDIDNFIECDKKGVSFFEKLLVTQPFLLIALSSVLCISAPSSSVVLNILVSAVMVSPITICLGAKTKSLKREIKELHTKRDTAYNLLGQYKYELYEKRPDLLCEENDKEILINISDIKVEKVQKEEINNNIYEQSEKPFVKTLTMKRYK